METQFWAATEIYIKQRKRRHPTSDSNKDPSLQTHMWQACHRYSSAHDNCLPQSAGDVVHSIYFRARELLQHASLPQPSQCARWPTVAIVTTNVTEASATIRPTYSAGGNSSASGTKIGGHRKSVPHTLYI